MAPDLLLRRIRYWLGLFIAALVVSGLTAFPLQWEVSLLARLVPHSSTLQHSELAIWLNTVQQALTETAEKRPFLSYGTDWLAFAHLTIAAAFVGPWLDPVRNKWLFTFGLIACAGVIPLALVAGGIRHIPFGWRLIDCSFGVFGAVPLWICRRMTARLESLFTA